MRGIAELMDGAMQQAPQPSRQFMAIHQNQVSLEQNGTNVTG